MTHDAPRQDRLALSIIGLVSSLVVIAVGFVLLGRQPQRGALHTVSALPIVNALLNGTSALLLTAGYCFIRQRRVKAHKTCMLTAFGVSTCFLVSYVIYHYHTIITPARSPSGATGGCGGSITLSSSRTSSSPP